MAVLLLAGVLFSTRKASQYLKARVEVEERLQHLSHTDELTGLYNRRGFFTLAEQQFRMAKRLKTKILLVSADVNGLKWINDNLGHHEGDKALIEAAEVLRESYRESDIIARVGGDEFVVLVAEGNDINRDVLTSRLRENLDIHQSRQSRTYELSISVGTVQFDPENPASLEELMISADQLMYQHKRQTKRSRRR
jgi:diguanylate cyclase (GGDEF)-like protein